MNPSSHSKIPVRGYAAFSPQEPLRPFAFERRAPGAHDVVIEILYSGICHSDIHSARDEWGGAQYPLVPGHEIVGRVVALGAAVKRHALGDAVGVGCFVDSCRTCSACKKGQHSYCEGHLSFTYNSTEQDKLTRTHGGYSTTIVVNEDFVLKIPASLPLDGAAPLLCAGITTYSPLKHWKIGKGHKVAVVGLGGLGHVAVKFAAALGAHVTVLSTSESKRKDAAALGAHEFLMTRNENSLKEAAGRFDFILDTASAPHDYGAYLELLKTDGVMVLVGLPDKPTELYAFPLVTRRRSLAGSLIGGIPETQEMLEFAAQHGIAADIERIPMERVNEAFERTVKGDVHYRFVIDVKASKL